MGRYVPEGVSLVDGLSADRQWETDRETGREAGREAGRA